MWSIKMTFILKNIKDMRTSYAPNFASVSFFYLVIVWKNTIGEGGLDPGLNLLELQTFVKHCN